ncbi:MAG: ABC transporter ATP-binding protein [Acidobacteria bacterium]|nr:ABC transporter ATP-binding protein [Acidobacteriota bacterium]
MDEVYDVAMQNVCKKFGDTVAVNNVSLDIRVDEFITLLGPSGCGKTTLLRMIAGFEIPDSGKILLDGVEVTRLPPYRRDVTTVFQQYALFPHLNVFQNVAFGLERRGVERSALNKRVAGALEMVRLEGLETRRPNELSGGQQQRVALARALVLEPKVLLLDEPLAALDLKLRKQMQYELKSLQKRLGISFIFVTHDQEEALTMSDRVVVMNAGNLEQVGVPQEIYERPHSEFVAGFIGDSNIIEGTVESSSADLSLIKISHATIPVQGNGVQAGQPVRVMIRPEKIRLSSHDRQGVLQGRIASAMYLGEATQWKVMLDGGQLLTVLEQNTASAQAMKTRVGQAVSLSWEADSAVLLRG